MGLREKVTIILVIITLIQIACRHCMPRTPRKASLKRYLNDLKPAKNNLAPTPYSPSRLHKAQKQAFGKTAQNGRINQNSLPKKSLYQTYKFPEMEFPLDNSPRDPFHIGMNFNDNNHVSTLQKARNLQTTAINDLKKEMKMKRKLLSNKQINSESSPLKTETSSIKFASYPDSKHLLDSESFPEVQYPLNTMDTWGPNHRSYLPLIQEKQFNGFGQQTLNRQAKENINKPFTRLTKAKASKYLQSYDKLKKEQRRTSTENSKRSNAGQKGLNFTKTATCEKTSDDFIIAGLVSNIPSSPTEIKRTLELSTETKLSSENTCPVTEYRSHYVPIPYRVIENNTENMCAFEQKNTTKELQDVDTSVIAQTLQLIEEILFHDDTSSAIPTGNYSKEIENNVVSSDCTDVPANEDIPITLMDNAKNFTDSPAEEISQDVPYISSAIPTGNYSKEIENNVDSSDCTDVSANEDIPITLMDNAKNFTDSPAEEISQEVPDDAPSGILQDKKSSIPEEILVENPTAVERSLSVRMPLQFSEPVELEAVTNATERDRAIMAPIANSNAVPGSTSIIIIPINNNSDGKSLPHILETTTGTSIVVYLPSTQNSGIPSQTQQIVYSSPDDSVPNNKLYNGLSNVAPLQNDNPSSTALVSELLNSVSDSGSSLPMRETLPINSMCYNNESSPSSMKEKPVSEYLIHKSLTEDASIKTKICDKNLNEQPTETDNFVMNTLPAPDFEQPLFDFAGSEFSSLSHGPYNNVLKNELPILTREINSYQQISNVASKDLFIPTQNVTPEYLHTNISYDALPEITKDASAVTMNQSFSTPTNSLPEPIIIDKMPPIPLTVTTVEKPPPITASLSLNPLSETLSENSDNDLLDMKVPPTPITTTDNTSSLSPVVNNSPITTDMSIKTELFKIRQILDKMLSDSQTTPMDSILSPISDTVSLPMLVKESLEHTQTLNDSVFLPAVDKTVEPLLEIDSPINSLGLQMHETHPSVPVDGTSSDTFPLTVDKRLTPSLLLDTADSPPLLIDDTVPPTPVFENPADNKPYFINSLVTPPFETRTKYTPKNDLSSTTDDVPSKLNLAIPNIHELPSDELLLPFDDLLIMVHEEPITNPKSEDSTKNLPTQTTKLVEPQNSHSNIPVSDMLYITKELSIPEVLEATLSDISSESETTTMGTKKIQQDLSPSIDLNSTEDEKKQTIDLPLSIIPDVFSDASLSPDSPSLTNAKIGDFPHTNTGTKDLLSVEDHLLSPEDDANPDTVVINSLSAVSLSTNLDNTNDEKLSEYTISDLPVDNLILADDKILPLKYNTLTSLPLTINKTPTTSKLSIAKALLENVLYDITKEGMTSSVTRPPPVTPSSILEITTKYQVDVESPLEAKEIPTAEKIFPEPETSTNLTNPDKAPPVSPILEIPTKDLPLQKIKSFTDKSDIPTDDIEKLFSPQERTETLPFENPADDVLLPTDKVSLPLNNLDRNSSDKSGPLENPADDFLLPTDKFALPLSTLDKNSSNKSGPLENPADDVLLPTDKVALPLNTLDRNSSDKSGPLEIPADDVLLPTDKVALTLNTLDRNSSDKSGPLENPADDVLLPTDKVALTLNNLDRNSSDKSGPLENLADDVILPTDKVALLLNTMDKNSSNKGGPLENPADDVLLPTDQVSLPLNTLDRNSLSNKIVPSASKLSIPKAILESVLSDVISKAFSLPTASKVFPVKSSSVLDKTTYNLESLLSVINEECPSSVNEIIPSTTLSDQPCDIHLPYSGQSKDSLSLEVYKTFSEVSSLDIPSVKTLMDKSDPTDQPNTKIHSSLKLPITKALLENVLLDVTSRDFSLPVSKILSVKSPSVLEKNFYYLESSPSDLTEENFSSPEIPSENEIISSITYSGQPTDNNLRISEQSKDTLPLEVDKTLAELSSLNIPSESLMNEALHKSNVDMTSLKAEILPKETPSDLPPSITETLSFSTLPIAKALLQNVLSDVTSKNFSLPVSKVLPVKSPSVLDKNFYYLESSPSDLTEENFSSPEIPSENEIISSITYSAQPTDNNLPISEQSEDTLPLEVDKTLAEVSNLNIPSESLMHETLLKSNVDMTSLKAEILPKETPSDLPSSITKTLSSSKLPIAKALLQNVLSDVTSKNFSLPVSKVPSVKSSSLLDKNFYYLEFSPSDLTEESFSPSEIPSENEIISSTKYSGHSINNNLPVSVQSEDTLPLDVDKTLAEVSSLNVPSETPMNKTLHKSNVDTTSLKAEILPKETPSDLPPLITETLSSSTFPIAKALLQNVLSDVTSKNFSLPVSKVLPVKSSSVLDKNFYYLESSPSDLTGETFSPSKIPSENEIKSSTKYSGQPIDSNLPVSVQSEDTLPLQVDTFSEVSNLNIPSETLMNEALLKSNVDMTSLKAEILPKETPSDLPSSITKTLSSSKLPIAKALLQNVLSDVTSKNFSLPVSKVLPVKSSSVLDETLYYVESPLSYRTEESEIISSTKLSDQTTDNNLPFSEPSENISPLEEDIKLSEVSSSEIPSEISSLMDKVVLKSNVNTSSPKIEILPKDTSSDPPLPSTKTLSSSKLSKALTENVLSDINTKGQRALPVAKSLPIESRSQLDKTLYYMDSPLSDWIEESLHNDLPSSEMNEDVFEQSLEKIFTDNPNLGMHTDDLPVDQISEDRSENLTEEIEDVESNETFSDNPMYDTDDLPSQVDERSFEILSEKESSFSENMPNDLPIPQHKRLFASRIPITKALLEKLLSDINDGGIRP